MADAKIRVKFGAIEIDYEGDKDFLDGALLGLVKELAELQPKLPIANASSSDGTIIVKPKGSSELYAGLSTNTCATLLGAQTGPDLILAASAYFTLTKNQSTFSRNELINEMKAAPGFFKDTYISNLSASLSSLTSKDKLRLISKDNYALSNKELSNIEAKLAQQG